MYVLCILLIQDDPITIKLAFFETDASRYYFSEHNSLRVVSVSIKQREKIREGR